MSRNNWWDVSHITVTHFYSVLIKDFKEFICFWEVLFCQLKKGLINIPFYICRIRRIIPYYFSLPLFIATHLQCKASNDYKLYIGEAKTPFKERLWNRNRDFCHRQYVKCKELSKYIWSLKDAGTQYNINWSIIAK